MNLIEQFQTNSKVGPQAGHWALPEKFQFPGSEDHMKDRVIQSGSWESQTDAACPLDLKGSQLLFVLKREHQTKTGDRCC